jgi:hypothetical protein
VNQEYYIRVYNPYGNGTYQIGFNTTTIPPGFAWPPTSTQLTANTWANGNIPTPSGEQWFKFTATASTQYIHGSSGTMTIDVKVFTSSGTETGGGPGWVPLLTTGHEYYLRVQPYTGTGTYQIGFNASIIPPGVTPTQLSANTWANGNISTPSGEWFRFTATAPTQYIHVSRDTISLFSVTVYTSSGGYNTGYTYSNSMRYFTCTLSAGQEYYIQVRPYDQSIYSYGTYKIGFNTNDLPPGSVWPPVSSQLSLNTWAVNNSPESGGERWFKFTATASTQYIHGSMGELTGLYVQVYASSGAMVGSEGNLNTYNRNTSRTLTVNEEYFMRVRSVRFIGIDNGDNDTYRIAFNASVISPS